MTRGRRNVLVTKVRGSKPLIETWPSLFQCDELSFLSQLRFSFLFISLLKFCIDLYLNIAKFVFNYALIWWRGGVRVFYSHMLDAFLVVDHSCGNNLRLRRKFNDTNYNNLMIRRSLKVLSDPQERFD